MKNTLLTLLLSAALALPALAQKTKVKTKGAAAATSQPFSARRLQPMFGGITPEVARQQVGEAFLKNIDQNFASRTEASQFFSRKGYEYLSENQADTARYRFNLAWMLDPNNAEAYRGLGLLASEKEPAMAISLFEQGLKAVPTHSALQSDLGVSYLLRYNETKKAKDLKTAMEYLQKSVATDANNAYAWQQLARGYYYQADYAQAWEALHKGQALDLSSVDFGLVAELQAKLPDPKGLFK